MTTVDQTIPSAIKTTHPATIIFILLAAGNLAGVLGNVFTVPTYAVSKVIVLNLVRFLRAEK